MASTCYSYLDVTAPTLGPVVDFRDAVSAGEECALSLGALLPVPDGVSGAQAEEWCVAHWACPGEPTDVDWTDLDEPFGYRYYLETQTAPPFIWVRAVRGDWPKITFRLSTYAPSLPGVSVYLYRPGEEPHLRSVSPEKYGESWIERARALLAEADARPLVMEDDRFGIGIIDGVPGFE